ncbi:hypothetical protein chiPu_0030629 [Chiloscyllium punctatum]|uniref:Immunoglobulin domain-containing protein n=1 Tax=Chiloscyllium punctatum TaxID=137246 RepID=A0A401TUT8_CHIPU|nr:hypothetical protein [Chiloscyllium punctatum]
MVNVSIVPKQQDVRLGGSVRLAVRMEPVPTSGTVIWRHRGLVPVKIAEITLQTNASRVHPATPYTGRSHISADASLEIGNLTWEDTGEYAVTLSVGPWEPTDSVHLHVFGEFMASQHISGDRGERGWRSNEVRGAGSQITPTTEEPRSPEHRGGDITARHLTWCK